MKDREKKVGKEKEKEEPKTMAMVVAMKVAATTVVVSTWIYLDGLEKILEENKNKNKKHKQTKKEEGGGGRMNLVALFID